MSHDKLYMLILCHPHDSLGNRAEALNGDIFSGSACILYLLVCSIASCFLFLITPNPSHNLIFVKELSFSVFCISSSELMSSVSSVFVDD